MVRGGSMAEASHFASIYRAGGIDSAIPAMLPREGRPSLKSASGR